MEHAKRSDLPVKEGNGTHGSHWEAVRPGSEWVETLVGDVVRTGKTVAKRWRGHNIETGREQDNLTNCHVKAMGSLRAFVLTVNGSLWSAYPVPATKAVYPLQGLHHVISWENQIEGQWAVKVLGASLTAFDPFFFRTQGQPPRTNLMKFSGFAYAVRKSQDPHLVVAGERRSARGAAFILPSQQGFPDDLMFQMPVQKMEEVDMMGSPGYRFTGPIFLGEGGSKPFIIPVYVAAHAIHGEVPGPGDDMEGTLWLQGSFVKKQEG